MKKFFEKTLIILVGISITFNPLVSLLPEKVKAATTNSTPNNFALIGIRNQSDYGYKIQSDGDQCKAVQEARSESYNDLVALITQYSGGQNKLTFSDLFTKNTSPKIVLPPKDREAVESLLCLTKVMPNFAEDYEALYNGLSASEKSAVNTAVNNEKVASEPRYTTYSEYFMFLKYGFGVSAEEKVANFEYITSLAKSAEKNFSESRLKEIWKEQADRIAKGQDTSIDANTLECVTGLSKNELRAQIGTKEGGQYIKEKIDFAINSLVIDIRVINTLIYLVTPKDEGGAGHWRVKVARILQDSEKSKESDSALQNNLTLTSANAGRSSTVQCDENMTAAECGRQQNETQVTVSDQGGKEYEAFFEDMDAEYDDQRNVSAHYTGQAVDIKEIDDIRCTLVQKRRLGGDKTDKKPTKPIKLVWQTEQGWNQSNGTDDFDTMGMMKDLAKQSLIDLLNSFDEDITDYEGDLSRANFNDLVGILGQSLLTQIIDSPGHNLEGYSVTDTVRTLGAMYFADYLQMPREVFTNVNLNSVEDIKYAIGRAAIEKRLGLPFGSLDNLNLVESNKKGMKEPVYDLEGLVMNVGQRKLEYELGFDAHDLDRYFKLGANSAENSYMLDNRSIGRIVIEDDLNLPKGSWPTTPVAFTNLKTYISGARVSILTIDPGYIDTLLHIDPGTTQSFMMGSLNSETYAEKVGKSRYNDTTAGLKYFEMNNAAYQLPGPTEENPDAVDTWAEALKGNPEYIKIIGIYTLGRLFGENALDINLTDDTSKSILPEDTTVNKIVISSGLGEESGITYNREEYGYYIFREWLRRNLDERITASQGCAAPKQSSTVEVSATYAGQSVYNGPVNLNNPTQDDIDNTVGTVCRLAQNVKIDSLEYLDKDGEKHTMKNLTITEDIPQTTAISVGLENFDLYSIMGYKKADARSVFQRIGSKLLYYGIANKFLNEQDRIKIDLMDTNPSLNVSENSNSKTAFYLPRILAVIDLTKKIKTEWNTFKQENQEDIKDITDRIDTIMNRLQSAYSEADPDLKQIRDIAASAKEIKEDVAAVKGELVELQRKYNAQSGVEAQKKLAQINAMILNVNELFRNLSEILAGKVIQSSDLLTIKQINQKEKTEGSDDNGNGDRTKGLSKLQIAYLLFDLLTGKMTPIDFIARLGANTAEVAIGLPLNSLLYLVQNYEKVGITGVNAFYQAVGQARIEEEFGMPAYYFQGYDYNKKIPQFDEMNENEEFSDLLTWAKDDSGKSLIRPEYDQYVADLKKAGVDEAQFPSINRYLLTKRFLDSSKFYNWVNIAKTQWLKKHKEKTSDFAIFEQNVDDIVKNIENQGYNSGLRSPEDDLLFRMGLPTGKYSALKENSPLAWQLASARVTAIDKNLNLPSGTTKMLFTGMNGITSNAISEKDKNILEASDLKIAKNELEKYIQLINGELLPSKNGEYQNGIDPDYVNNNPYADPAITGPTCPITFTEQNGFMVNENTLDSDSFCYYDKKGRHCFQSYEEAQAFANSHPDDQIKNIIEDLAMKIATAYNQSLIDENGNMTGTRLNYANVYSGLVSFVNDKKKATIFDYDTLDIIANNGQFELLNYNIVTQVEVSKIAFKKIGDLFKVPDKVLTDLFTREYIDAPLTAYKQKVGIIESQKIITYKLFDQFGLDIDPGLFDGEDFYDILTGDYSSLYRLGTSYIDSSLNLKPGTTMLIYTARTPEARKCALDQAGGIIIGKAFGLNYFPIGKLAPSTDTFMNTLGQELIEEKLSLPRGTFRVDSGVGNDKLENLVKNVGIINFVSAFKIPINLTDPSLRGRFEQGIYDLLGEQKYGFVKDTSAQYKLQRAKEFLASSLVISNQSNRGRIELENVLKELMLGTSGIFSQIASLTTANSTLLLTPPEKPDKETAGAYADYNLQVQLFYKQAAYLDSLFGISEHSTYLLLGQQITPSNYIQKVGELLGKRIGGLKLAERIGLDAEESQAAVDIVTNIQRVFSCKSGRYSTDENGVKYCISSGFSKDKYYHNWGFLYSNLDKIFEFKFDDHAGFPNGTIQKILDNPNATFPILLAIGAQKLDQKLFPNDPKRSEKVASVSGLFRALFPEDLQPMQEECHAQAFPDGRDVELDNQMALAQSQLKDIENEFDSLDLPPGDYTSPDYVQSLGYGGALKFNTWNAKRLAKIDEIKSLETEYNTRVAQERNCLLTAQKEAAASRDNEDMDDIPYGDLQKYLGRVWQWAQDVIAEFVHEQILNVKVKIPNCDATLRNDCTANVGIDMPISDIKAMLGMDREHPGMDLHYFTAATMAMGANIVYIALDNITTTNCNPRERDGESCRAPIPEGMRIDYDEIKVALFGLSESQLQQLTVWSEVSAQSGTNFKPNPDDHAFSQESCEPGQVFDGIMCVAQVGNGTAAEDVNAELSYQYGYNAENVAALRKEIEDSITANNQWAAEQCTSMGYTDESYDNCYSIVSDELNMNNNVKLDMLNHPEYYNMDNDAIARKIQEDAKRTAREKIQYDMMDAALWKLDENVFPGFTRALFKGNPGEKWGALAQYLKNGLVNGHLFGFKFDAIDPNMLDAALAIAAYFTAKTDTQKKEALNNLTSAKFSTIVNFISQNSKDWLGINLDVNITEGLVTSLITGEWGADSFSLDNIMTDQGHIKMNLAGEDRWTFGGAVVNWGLSRIFSWADKALGLQPGQSLQLFMNVKSVYQSYQAYQAAKKIAAITSKYAKVMAEWASKIPADALAKPVVQGLADSAAAADKAAQAQVAAKKEALSQAASAGVQFVIGILVDKLLGKTLAGIENSLGLVPGTLAPIVAAGIYDLAVPALNSAIAAMGGPVNLLQTLGFGGWAMILAGFILTNLFGVYRVELWCTADGYYPEYGKPDYQKNDISGMGVWGGVVDANINNVIKNKSVEAAQYKANQLIGDMMEIQYNPDFNDLNGLPTIPTQIMTGRAEDVDYWKFVVGTNVCQQNLGTGTELLFDGSTAVCDAGMRRMGLWQNPQTTAWTHIGF